MLSYRWSNVNLWSLRSLTGFERSCSSRTSYSRSFNVVYLANAMQRWSGTDISPSCALNFSSAHSKEVLSTDMKRRGSSFQCTLMTLFLLEKRHVTACLLSISRRSSSSRLMDDMELRNQEHFSTSNEGSLSMRKVLRLQQTRSMRRSLAVCWECRKEEKGVCRRMQPLTSMMPKQHQKKSSYAQRRLRCFGQLLGS